jgi:hypothetical protein
LGSHLALLTHGGSAATLILNLASNTQAGLLLLALAVFPLQLVMGGITAVRLLLHLPHHLLLLGFFMGSPLHSTTITFGGAPTLAAPLFLHVGVLMGGLHSPSLLLLVIVGGCVQWWDLSPARRPGWLDFERKINLNRARNLFFLAMVLMARIRIFREIVHDSKFLRLS